jgi:archaellum biogenesis protein FlaJ (TadC family)
LGSYNTSGLIFTYYSLVSGIVSSLNSLALNVESYFNVSTSISASIASAQSNISSLISQLNNIDSQYQSHSSYKSYLDSTPLYIKIFYSTIIGLCTLSILGALLMCVCDRPKCRYLMYFACFFLVVVSLVGLLVTTVVSVLLPPMEWGCQFLNYAMQGKTQFSRMVWVM